jgi:predicted nucleic acid-binding protein
MAGNRECYVDTSALIALLDRSDSYHALFAQLFADPPPLVTTSLVVAEGHGWFLRRYDSFRALQFLAFAKDLAVLRVLSVGIAEINSGGTLLRKFPDQRLTLADAVGLHVMRERGIRTCWATDAHLGLTGVPLIIHQA